MRIMLTVKSTQKQVRKTDKAVPSPVIQELNFRVDIPAFGNSPTLCLAVKYVK